MNCLHKQEFVKCLVYVPLNATCAIFFIMCMSNCRQLVISPSYHTCISFVLYSILHNVTYPPWFATSYNYTSFTLLVLTCHWWFGYPCALVPMRERTHYMILFGMLSHLLFWKVWKICTKNIPTFFLYRIRWQVDILITLNNFRT
jgi:hypothetical protein